MPHAAPAFAGLSAYPPSFQGEPWTYLWAVFGLMLLELLAIEWAWRLGVGLATERNRRLRDPITINRVMLLLMLCSPILGGMPDLIYLMKWPEWTPATREAAALIDRQLDGVIWMPFCLAWLIFVLAGPMIDWQLVREPLPINLWPTWAQLKRPAKIGAGVFVIAFIITFLR